MTGERPATFLEAVRGHLTSPDEAGDEPAAPEVDASKEGAELLALTRTHFGSRPRAEWEREQMLERREEEKQARAPVSAKPAEPSEPSLESMTTEELRASWKATEARSNEMLDEMERRDVDAWAGEAEEPDPNEPDDEAA